MRLLRRILVIYSICAILLALVVNALLQVSAQGNDPRMQVRNAAWIDHHWVATAQSTDAVAGLCTLLRTHAIGTVYVHVGPADASGRIAEGRAPAAGHFITTWHAVCPQVRALAWIGQLLPSWDGLLDLRSANVRDGLVRTAARFTQLGFDGIQYDLEPVPNGDAAYLDLLTRTRAAIGSRWLAVATPPLLPPAGLPRLPHLQLPLIPWSGSYYQQVAALVDELDPMLYVTSLRRPDLYSRFVAEQVHDLSTHLPHAHLLIGLPTFPGRDGVFDDRVENLSSALSGISSAFGPAPLPDALAGVALYPLWDMTPAAWHAYDGWLRATTAR